MTVRTAGGALIAAGLLLFASATLGLAAGPLNNGNFNGNLSGWSTAGYAAAVGAQGSVVPFSGSFQALIASGENDCPTSGDPPRAAIAVKPGTHGVKPHYSCGSTSVADVWEAALESDLNLPSGAIATALPNNQSPTYGAAIWQTFSVTAPTTLSFHWNFATNEVVPSSWDAALYTWQVGSNPAQVFELADTTQSSLLNQSAGSSPTFTTMTGYALVTIPISAAGTYTIGFISMQTGDDEVSSGTYISDVQVGNVPTTPVPPAWGLALIGVALMSLYFGWRRLTGPRGA
jgi:hypothetical protein